VASAYNDYANKVRTTLFDAGIRVDVDDSDETMGYKIRAAQTQKIPYMLIVGEREKEASAVAVRHRKKGDLGAMPVEAFLEQVQGEIASRALDD
ncbi:MAG: threonine--tRNA ligase, partial [Candidatus Hydrogenedentes bacterium]|nr:threonine--tRNA ligase [Candidatus Hydrogenedentota bacterium]